MSKQITTIIFDLGRVLVRFDPKQGLKDMGFSDETVQVFMDKIFSGIWEDCDGRRMTLEESISLFKSQMPGYEKEVDVLWEKMPLMTGVFDYSTDWIKSLKKSGYRLLVLSNFGEASFEIVSKGYEFLQLMDGKVMSYEVETKKPEERIYRILMNRYNVKPEEAVFIDDRKENIDAAVRLGLRGIVFQDYMQAKEELKRILEAVRHF